MTRARLLYQSGGGLLHLTAGKSYASQTQKLMCECSLNPDHGITLEPSMTPILLVEPLGDRSVAPLVGIR